MRLSRRFSLCAVLGLAAMCSTPLMAQAPAPAPDAVAQPDVPATAPVIPPTPPAPPAGTPPAAPAPASAQPIVPEPPLPPPRTPESPPAPPPLGQPETPVPSALPEDPTTKEILPSDFLEHVSQLAKGRWRMQYTKTDSASPPTERLKVAFTLGGLIAENCLALQTKDAQQFRNINQDISKYAGSLGLTDKVTPTLLAESKMAETEDWAPLRPKLAEKQRLITRLLEDQRDEDLALMVHLGMWLRIYEMTANIVQADPQVQNRSLCIGSLPLLTSLRAKYDELSEHTRSDPNVAAIGRTLDQLLRQWSANERDAPQEVVDYTLDRLVTVLNKFRPKQPGP